MKKIPLLGAIAAIALAITGCSKKEVTANYGVIPQPQEVTASSDSDGFKLTSSTVIACADPALATDAAHLTEYLRQMTGLDLKTVAEAPESDAIVLSAGLESDNPEAYELTVGKDLITINGASPAGTFYGIQTLRKSIPEAGEHQVLFPCVTIKDYPRFAYRGAMLDTSRHMFPTDSVKKFIDMLAMHNINRFHWHISDDQGWRLEIKSRPELTEKGAMRSGTCVGKEFGTTDSVAYGGFYTQEEARDIVKYAADRHITVIPEIDMPGHMLAALTAYPELGCTGGPYEVWTRWGVSEDVLCAGNDSVLSFIDDVLGEVIDIFPSEYIHVGGDECPKVRWKDCAKCQAKARQLGIKAGPKGTVEEQLQSYLIHHASDFLTSNGRKMIGWDETLEGGLAPGAVVMSWRGEDGAKEAARQGHDAIMTPTGYMYFDYYQSLDRDNEPLAIGGYVPLEKVYSFNPLPDDLTDEQKQHIIGVQANLWTEYIPDFTQVEYMELPRMAALSEVQWTQPEKRDYVDFTKRVAQLTNLYRANGLRFATHVFDVNAQLTPNPSTKAVDVTMSTVDDAPIHYTLDGTTPTEDSPLYTEPIALTTTSTIKAAAFRPTGMSKVFADSVNFNKATSRPITLATQPHSRYAADGPMTLVDGKLGTSGFGDGTWLGFYNGDLDAVIDMGEPTEVSKVTVRALVETNSWIFDATELTVKTSDDGVNFTTVASEKYPVDEKNANEIRTHSVTFAPVKARYVEVIGGCLKQVPAWLNSSRGPAFAFFDEIIVE